ncbi:hypothetical protein TWF730_003987 [Orbilia blumenaviensis]|uniref:F-box domain-containing protein n=1 Tax=Orbilia blumenaviensis TaxID=1796055 RepID=A0AAV9U2A0_9PEZI
MANKEINLPDKACGPVPLSVRENIVKDDRKTNQCHLAMVPNEINAEVLSLLPFVDQLHFVEAYPKSRAILSFQSFENKRYTWKFEFVERELTFSRWLSGKAKSKIGKHILFAVEDGYIECRATSGVLNTCTLKQGPSDYFINARSSADISPCLEDKLYGSVPPPNHQHEYVPPHYERSAVLQFGVHIFDEIGNTVTIFHINANDVLKLPSEDAARNTTFKDFLDGIARTVEGYLGQELRKRAHYGRKFEFQVFPQDYHNNPETLRVEVHPDLDEIWPFPKDGGPSRAVPALVETDSDPVFRRTPRPYRYYFDDSHWGGIDRFPRGRNLKDLYEDPYPYW